MTSSAQAAMIRTRRSQIGQLVATRSFSTELRWRVLSRCWRTNVRARPGVIGSRKKRARLAKSSTTSSSRLTTPVAVIRAGRSFEQDGPELRDHGRLELEQRFDGTLDLLRGHGLDLELLLLGVGQERGIAQRLLEGLAQDLHAVLRRAGWQRVGAHERAVVVDGHLDDAARLVGLGVADRQRHVGKVGMRLRRDLQHDLDFPGVEALAPRRAQRAPAPARPRQLSALGREPDLRRALVAGDDLRRQADCRARRSRDVVGVRCARRHATHLHGVGEAIHFSRLVIPLATVVAQTGCSYTGAPMYSNFRASNSTPFWPRTWPNNRPPMKWPMVSPSGLAIL